VSAQPGEKEPFETAVLELLWSAGPKTPREVHSAIGEPRHWAYTTTLTLLHRLHARGLLQREKAGRTHRYRPSMKHEQHRAHEARRMAEALSKLGESGVAAFLAEARSLDPALVDQLRRQLKDETA
jgi:predicted transcriptional regulator